MKIIKYVKKNNNNYDIYLDNDKKITINEDIILKHKLLFKKEIDDKLLKELTKDNDDYDIYNTLIYFMFL